MEERPFVGIGVIVVKDNKVLLGKRKAAHGEGTWSFPGGHLEFGETPEECAQRETMEETGISIKNIKKAVFTNDIFKETGKHYVTLFLTAESAEEPQLREPDKFEKWQWFFWNKLPKPLFLCVQNLLKEGFDPRKVVI
jgi:8-oxo-dGTP diphosphatase